MSRNKQYFMRMYPIIGDEPDPFTEVTVKMKKDEKGRPYYEDGEGNRLFTQDHMNTEIGAARKKEGDENKKLINQLREMQERATTSETMKIELQQQIENLQNLNLTKEEQMVQKIKSLETDLQKTKENMAIERDAAVNRWQEERIKNELQAAAVSNRAFSSDQIYGLLRGQTQLKQVFDDLGKPMDKFEVVVALDVPDADGKTVKKELPPAEALKVMKTDLKTQYQNLFVSEDRPGMGGGNQSGSVVTSDTPPPEALKSFDAYQAWAEKNMKGRR